MSQSVNFQDDFKRDHAIVKRRLEIITANFKYKALVRRPETEAFILDRLQAADAAMQEAYNALFLEEDK